MWQETWFVMSDGDLGEYSRLKAMDVFEFYKVYDMWKYKLETERANQKNKK